MRRFLAIVAAGLLSMPARAASDDVFSSVVGSGGFTCGQFIQYHEAPNNNAQMAVVVNWVWGYLVAYNHRGFFDVTVGHPVSQVVYPDEPTVLLFVEQFCRKNPLSTVMNATNALLKNLSGRVVWRPTKVQ
jgi:hypothetical protein